MRACSVIDAPSDLGLRRTGVDGLPEALRAAGLLEGLTDYRYAGRVPVPPYVPLRDDSTGVLNPAGITTYARRLAERVGFTLDLGRFPLVLGGDCSILLGTALALRRRGRFGLFFVDGHADYYSPESEPTGEVASMDLALVTGRGPRALTEFDGTHALAREEDTVLFAFRDAADSAAYGSPDVRQSAIHAMDLAEVRRLGARRAAEQALDVLESNALEGFWVHLDADVLNDAVMPAVDYRMPDGLWPEELTDALAVALRSRRVLGMQVTIYNPTFDDPERTAARTLAHAVTSAFARAA